MFLLILLSCTITTGLLPPFKFHYVSINSCQSISLPVISHNALNSIMFLLIPSYSSISVFLTRNFKFHYVSINSQVWRSRTVSCISLNSIMFLLILRLCLKRQNWCWTLNSIMFLLIQNKKSANKGTSHYFKFHYVSINSKHPFYLISFSVYFKFHYVSINSVFTVNVHACQFLL